MISRDLNVTTAAILAFNAGQIAAYAVETGVNGDTTSAMKMSAVAALGFLGSAYFYLSEDICRYAKNKASREHIRRAVEANYKAEEEEMHRSNASLISKSEAGKPGING